MTTVLAAGATPTADELRRGLDGAGLLRGAPTEPYTVVVGAICEPWVEAAVVERARGDARILVVDLAPAEDVARTWELLARGAEDVLHWGGARSVGQVVDRVDRWRDVDEAMAGPAVAGRFVGNSRALRRALIELVELAVFGVGPVLLTGETGTGKELAARAVHDLGGRAADGTLVVVDCTTIVPTLSGSELFGHERGAFTGADRARAGAVAAADGGTLFLDEVGELPLALQAELLRVVQEHTYKRVGGDSWAHSDFRLVTATNRDLRREQKKGRFRSDLYHRLASGVVQLPPLRERRDDLEPLFRHFLAEATGRPAMSVAPAVLDLLHDREFPGNLRELRQLATRVAARHAGSGPVTPGDLLAGDRPPARPSPTGGTGLEAAVRRSIRAGASLQDLKSQVSDLALTIALAEAEGNAHAAAQRLGVTDRAIQKRLQSARGGAGPPPRASAPQSPPLPP